MEKHVVAKARCAEEYGVFDGTAVFIVKGTGLNNSDIIFCPIMEFDGDTLSKGP